MAIKSYFFNAIKQNNTYDRVYNSEDVTSYLDKLVGNGVFASPSTQLQVSATTGMTVNVNVGQGWINGHKLVNTAILPLVIDTADVVLNRIDRVIMYCDLTTRMMGIEVKKGTPAATAVPPDLIRTDQRYELCLAQITVNKQVTAITNSMITDTRGNSSLCGYVAALIDQIDTTNLFQQYDEAFNDWFSDVKDTLSTATLLRKFEGVYTTQTNNEYSFNVLNYVPQYVYELDVLEVRINGLTLNETEYGKNGSLIVLNTPITHAGTPITFTVYKSVDGSDAETVIDEVAELQRVVNMIETGVYIATGVDDNIKLSDTVKSFLEQTSKNMLEVTAQSQSKNGVTFSINADGVVTAVGTATANTFLSLGRVNLKRGVSYMLTGCPVGGGHAKYRLYWQETVYYDNGQGVVYTPTQDQIGTVNLAIYEGMEVNLTFYPMVRLASISDDTWEPYGTSAIDDNRQIEIDVYGDLGISEPTSISGDSCYWFDFYVQGASRLVKLNFEHCPRIVVDASASGVATDTMFHVGSMIEISNAQAVMNNVNDGYMVSDSDGDCYFEKCAFWMNGATNATGDVVGANNGTFNECRMAVTAHNTNSAAYGFSSSGNVLRLNDCEVLAYNASGSSKESVAVHVMANETENVLIMNGCSCPLRSRSGYKQDNVVKINSGFYCLVGNMLGKASAKYSTGDGKTEIGTMIVSK